jgi:hypothetical protein
VNLRETQTCLLLLQTPCSELRNCASQMKTNLLRPRQKVGEEYTLRSLDAVVRVLSAAVSQNIACSSSYRIIIRSGYVFSYSPLTKCIAIDVINNSK